MKQLIKNHLITNPSYFKWSNLRLAKKYNCSERTISNIVNELSTVKKEYLRNLNF